MARVTKEQIEAAKRVDILDYLLRHEPDNLKREGANRHTLRDHDSFVVIIYSYYISPIVVVLKPNQFDESVCPILFRVSRTLA